MKKLIAALFAVALCCAMAWAQTPYGGARAELEEMIAEIDSECPMDMGASGSVESVKLENDRVVFYYALDRMLPVEVEALKHNPEVMKGMATAAIGPSNPDSKAFLDLLVRAGVSVRYVYYKEGIPQVSASCIVTSSELKALQNSNLSEREMAFRQLQEMVNVANLSFPVRLDECTVLRAMKLEAMNVVYEYYVDEDQLPLSSIDRDMLKSVTFSSLDVSDEGIRMLLELCVACNKGLAYRYMGDASGQSIVVSATPAELAAKLDGAE